MIKYNKHEVAWGSSLKDKTKWTKLIGNENEQITYLRGLLIPRLFSKASIKLNGIKSYRT